jgi:hypothetical protein
VPGTWVLAPAPGYLWTPGYWAFAGGGYLWHFGYWSDEVGYYGGINYGYGYFGSGYSGGRWDRGAFNYNRSVNNINTRLVHHVYTQAVSHNPNRARTSFNGGPGGVATQPSAAEANIPAGRRMEPTEHQSRHEHSALEAPAQRASVNHGAPQLAATRKPSEFVARGMEPQRLAPSQPARPAQPQAQPSRQQAPLDRQATPQAAQAAQAPREQPRQQSAQPQAQPQAQPPRQQERPQVRESREQREPREQRAPDRQRDEH